MSFDNYVTGPEGYSMNTVPKPKDDKKQKLQPAAESTEPQNPNPLIRKASVMLPGNKNLEKYYEPRAVSIGPLHHGNRKYSLAEDHKYKLKELFLKETGLDDFKLQRQIKNQIEKLKQCYVEEDLKRLNISNEDLSWMLVTDGCALLHYICYAANGKLNDLKIGMDMEAFSQHDLFLLENQLPFQVLDIIMKNTADGGANMRSLIDKFIDKTVRDIRGPSFGETAASSTTTAPPHQPAPAHLLQLLWKRLVGDFEKEKAETTGQKTLKTEQKQQVGKVLDELKAAGIQFVSETSGSLRDISFVSHDFTGTLKLPSLAVDDSTATKLCNLIAFEMCPDFRNDCLVTSYIFFLNSLIDKPDDVQELRKARILHYAFGSDGEEVARLFKEIGTDLEYSIPEAYLEVKDGIQKHCEKRRKTWNKLLGSPWTFLAFVTVIAVLIMSFSFSSLVAP